MTSTHRHGQRSSKISPVVEALVSGDRAGVGGVLCNDPSGLCLLSKGNMDSDDGGSGVYTSLVRLASQLSPQQRASSAPLIIIESESTSVLVKEYDGHAVALKVPSHPKLNDETDD